MFITYCMVLNYSLPETPNAAGLTFGFERSFLPEVDTGTLHWPARWHPNYICNCQRIISLKPMSRLLYPEDCRLLGSPHSLLADKIQSS